MTDSTVLAMLVKIILVYFSFITDQTGWNNYVLFQENLDYKSSSPQLILSEFKKNCFGNSKCYSKPLMVITLMLYHYFMLYQ